MRDEEERVVHSPDAFAQPFHPSSLIPHPSTAAILLAAGRSRRMGAFKPLLPFPDERTVAEACINHLQLGGVETIVVVLGHRADEVRERLSALPVLFALNEEAESEMGASIARGVEKLPSAFETILIALCDQPAIPPKVIRFLISECHRTGARLVVPEFMGRGGHPVLVDNSFRAELLRLGAERGLRALFDTHRTEVLRVGVDSAYVARDMDTWDDYCALYLELFGAQPPTPAPRL